MRRSSAIQLLRELCRDSPCGLVIVFGVEAVEQHSGGTTIAGVSGKLDELDRIGTRNRFETSVRAQLRTKDIQRIPGPTRRQQLWQQLLGQSIGETTIG